MTCPIFPPPLSSSAEPLRGRLWTPAQLLDKPPRSSALLQGGNLHGLWIGCMVGSPDNRDLNAAAAVAGLPTGLQVPIQSTEFVKYERYVSRTERFFGKRF
jgi:hypothetical protein